MIHAGLHIGKDFIEFQSMKPLSSHQVQNLAQELNQWTMARLQEVGLYGDCLCLGFFKNNTLLWLVTDMSVAAPQLFTVPFPKVLQLKEHKKPIGSFLSAHFKGRHLAECVMLKDFGRVLELSFSEGGRIQLRLIPRAANVLVTLDERLLAYRKPLELKTVADYEGKDLDTVSLSEAGEIWLREKKKTSVNTQTSAEDDRQKLQKKLSLAKQKLETEIAKKTALLWSEAGQWLKSNQSLSGDEAAEFKSYFDPKKTWTWNLDNCFRQAKELAQKMEGSKARLLQLNKQLAELEAPDWQPKQPQAKPILFQDSAATGRTHQIDEALFFFIGKSAQDNLLLLRQARPWDLWLHLRDYPGSYGILQRNKNQVISDAQLHRAAHHLLQAKFKSKHEEHDKEKFQILVAECRFLRPIKGDRLGRVNYSSARTLLHQYVAKS